MDRMEWFGYNPFDGVALDGMILDRKTSKNSNITRVYALEMITAE